MIKQIQTTPTDVTLHDEYSKSAFSLFILTVSLILAFINVVLKDDYHIGVWNIVSFLLLLAPLGWMIIKKEIKNRYTVWFLPVVLILLTDIFVYSNAFVQGFLPGILFLLIVILYLSSMQNVQSLYQTLIPHKAIPFKIIGYIKMFIGNLLIYKKHKSIYSRVGLALLITVPFIALFMSLFMAADINFSTFIESLFRFDLGIKVHHAVLIPIYLVAFLLLFIYSLSNAKERETLRTDKQFDPLIVGIFLGMLNLLFITFLLFQINYLFGGESYIKEMGINIAEFARQGFFQLMWVMGIVLSIFLLIMSRYHGEKGTAVLLSGLILSTMVIGLASLKKMHLYQSIKGATVLRYYVEWFDYFLLLVLGLGIVFILKRIYFSKLLDSIVFIAIIAFTIVSSMNIDYMVASHNIKKFGNTPKLLDKKAISELSIDALPVIHDTDIGLKRSAYRYDPERHCDKLKEYHYGYCSLIKEYGSDQMIYVDQLGNI
jgi:hypothetical protein